MICCRNTRISASIAARGRNRSTIIPKIILQRSRIPQSIIRFCVSRQPDGIYDRDITGGKGVDVIVDMVSGSIINQTLHAATVKGYIVAIGGLGGNTAEFNFDLHSGKRIR